MNYSLCYDAVELNKASAQDDSAVPTVCDSGSQSSALVSDSDWVMSELEHSLKQFQQQKQRCAAKQQELEHKKEQYDQKRRAVSTGATQGFLDRFVQIMTHTPHAKLPSELPVKVSARVEE